MKRDGTFEKGGKIQIFQKKNWKIWNWHYGHSPLGARPRGRSMCICNTYIYIQIYFFLASVFSALCGLAPTWPNLASNLVPTWLQMVSTWPNLAKPGPNLVPTWAQLRPNLAQLGPNLVPNGPNLAQPGPNLALIWPQLGFQHF